MESLSNVAVIIFSGGQEQNIADGLTDGRTDRHTDGRTDRRTQGNPIVPNGETGRGLINIQGHFSMLNSEPGSFFNVKF